MSHFPIAFLVSALMIAAIGGCQRMESTGDSGDSDVQPAVQSHGSDAPNGDKASDQ